MFRAGSVGQGWQMIKNLQVTGDGKVYSAITDVFNKLFEVQVISRAGFGSLIQIYPWLMLVIFIVILIVVCLVMRNTQEKVNDGRYQTGRIVTTVVLLLWSVLSLSEVSEFLYFNF